MAQQLLATSCRPSEPGRPSESGSPARDTSARDADSPVSRLTTPMRDDDSPKSGRGRHILSPTSRASAMQTKELQDRVLELESRNADLLAQVCEQRKAWTEDQSQTRVVVDQTFQERESALKNLEELQVEFAQANAQAKSKQLRVEGMERDVEIYQQRVKLAEAMEDQMRNLKIESMKHLDERVHVQEKLDAYRRQSEQANEELLSKLSHMEQECDRAQNRALLEKQQRENLEHQLAASNSERRKLAADKDLLEEDVDALRRDVKSLKAENESLEQIMQKQQERIKEVEEKWSSERLIHLQASIREYDGVVMGLRTQLDETMGRMHELEGELRDANSRARSREVELDRTKERMRQLDEELTAVKESTDMSKDLKLQNVQLKDRMEQVLCDARIMAEMFERDSAVLRESNAKCLAEKDALVLECAMRDRTVAENARLSQVAEEFCRQGEANANEAQRSQKDFEEVTKQVGELTKELQDFTAIHEHMKQNYETTIKLREREGAALLTRVQALSSNYTPVKGDPVDEALAKYIHAYQPAIPFIRVGAGLYTFGKKQVACKVSNDKPVFRVGGGFIGFVAFLDTFLDEELTRVLYENDNNSSVMDRSPSQMLDKSLRISSSSSRHA